MPLMVISAPGRSDRHHPPLSRRRPHRRPHGVGHDAHVSRPRHPISDVAGIPRQAYLGGTFRVPAHRT
jgi:hypothetical protein